MSFREYQEWIILLNAEEDEKASGTAGRAGSGNGSGAAWQNQMAMMKMISLKQQIADAGKRKKNNGRN